MRTILFDGDDAAELFELIYEGFLLGQPAARGADRSGGFGDVRIEARILQRLHAISSERRDASGVMRFATGDPVRTLTTTPATLELSDRELDLLRRYYESVRWQAQHAVAVVAAADLLGRSPSCQ